MQNISILPRTKILTARSFYIALIFVFFNSISLESTANVIPDPSFENAAIWETSYAQFSLTTSPVRTGTKALKLISDSPVPSQVASQQRITGVVAGQEYEYSVWVAGNALVGVGGGGKPLAVVRWRNSAGSVIRTFEGKFKESYLWAPYNTYNFRKMSMRLQAPTGATMVDILFRTWSDTLTGFSTWDDVSLAPRDLSILGTKQGTYQAETADVRSGGTVLTDKNDYTGTGFYDVDNLASPAATLQWNNVTGSGNRVISVRYSWEGNEQNIQLFVNGASQGIRKPLPTGRRGVWASDLWEVNLPNATNTIKLVVNRSGGLNSQPIIDKIDVYTVGGGGGGGGTPPATAPTGVTASDDSFTDKVAVSWNAVAGATFYQVYRAAISGNNGSLQSSPVGTSYDDTAATAGTNYYYSVKACNADGCSDFSAQDQGSKAVTPAPPPAVPTGVTASDDAFTDKVAVSWNAVAGATFYEVYRATVSGNNGTKRSSPAGTSYNDTAATAGTIYYYSVKACNADGCSDFSTQDQGSKAVTPAPPPAVPTGVTASDDTFTDKVVVSWNIVAGATSYQVYRAAVSGNNGSLRSSPVGTSYNDTAATAGTIYYYSVKACNADGCSDFSAQDQGSKAVTPTAPAVPSGVVASDDIFTDKVAVSWSASADATFYELYRSTVMGDNGLILSPSLAVINFDDTTATAGTTYYYSVKACNTVGCSAFSTQNAGSRAIATIPVIEIADITIPATGLFTTVELGTAKVTDDVDDGLVATPDKMGPFESGRHIITWSVTDSSMLTATAQQIVDVQPMADFQLAQNVGEGGMASVSVILSGQAAVYPVTIPYTVSGSAGDIDHDATSGDLIITQGTRGEIMFNVVADPFADEGETIEFTLGTPLSNAVPGTNDSHVSTIIGVNLPAQVQLTSTQATLVSNQVAMDQGNVVISTTITDPNPTDTHTYDWTMSDNSLLPVEGFNASTFTFDPSVLQAGIIYIVRVSVTDSGFPAQSTSVELMLTVDDTRATLTTADSDNDGTDDVTEGYGDTDKDGIPDYLDAVNDPASLPGSSSDGTSYLMQTTPGLTMMLGQSAIASGQNAAAVTMQNIINNGGSGGGPGLNTNDDNYQYSNGLFDFVVGNLPITGQSVEIVIPVQGVLATGAVYRKYTQDLGWQDFVVDAKNKVASAMGTSGNCPLPGDGSYTDGLTAGHYCIQLTIEDGGPNDADGSANSVVRDPGGVALVVDSTPPPTSNTTPQATSGGGGGGSQSFYLMMLILMTYLVSIRRSQSSR